MAETIGSLVDKISIMDLKIYHMQEQVDRADNPADHRGSCKKRVAILSEQRGDLVQELSDLTADVLSGSKKLKIYRQFKMYNDARYRIPAK